MVDVVAGVVDGEVGAVVVASAEPVSELDERATITNAGHPEPIRADRNDELAAGVSIAPDAVDNAVLLTGGNIVVPHQTGGGKK